MFVQTWIHKEMVHLQFPDTLDCLWNSISLYYYLPWWKDLISINEMVKKPGNLWLMTPIKLSNISKKHNCQHKVLENTEKEPMVSGLHSLKHPNFVFRRAKKQHVLRNVYINIEYLIGSACVQYFELQCLLFFFYEKFHQLE